MSRSAAKLIASGSALQVVRFGAGVVVAFFLTPFVIHSLGDRMYGFWALAAVFIGYYGMMDLGLGVAVSRYAAGAAGKGDREEFAGIFSTALQLYSALGAVVLAITAVIALVAPRFASSPDEGALFWKVILILGVSVALSFPIRAHGGVLTAELRFDAVAVVDILTLLLRTALIVAVLLAGYKLLALAWVSLFSGLPRIAAYLWLTRKQCPWLHFRRQPFFGRSTRELFSYSAFALLGNLSNQVRFNVDAMVITAIVGLAAVTHFRIAGLMVAYFMTLMTSVVGTIQPWFSRMEGAGDHKSIERTLLLSTKISVCVAGFVGFGFIAWGKPFIQRWMGASYLDAYPCLVVLALGYFAALAQYPSICVMFGLAKHKVLAVINTFEAVANLALSLWLAKSMGIFGVALGTFIPMAFTKLVVQPVYFCHVSPVSYGQYMRQLGRSCAAVAGALVVPFVISMGFAGPAYPSLLAIALASAVCYAAAIGFLQFNRTELEALKRALLPSRRREAYGAVLSE